MDSTPTSKSPKKYTLPVKFCDMKSLDGILPNMKSKAITPRPVQQTMPVRFCDIDWASLGSKSAKKNSIKKELWKTQKENKNTTKIQKNCASVSAMRPKKGCSHDENLPLIDLENFENNPISLKKPVSRQKPKTAKCSRIAVAKPKKINGPTVVSEIIYTDFPSIKKEIPRNKHVSSAIKLAVPPLPSPKSTAQSLRDEQKLMVIFEKKINEITNKLELKYNEIISRLDKLELNRKTECELCAKKSFTSTSSSSYAQNELNSSCFIVDNDKIIKSQVPDSKDNLTTVDIPEVNNMNHDVLSKNDDNLKPKQLFNDLPKPLQDINENKLFELLEARVENESPKSLETSLSDTDLPLLKKDDMTWMLSDNKETNLMKFMSTPSLVTPKKKTVKFLSKSYHDLRSDPYGMYNEIRDNVKFLCTPKNTKILSNLMTPSAENSQKKLISRRVQKQLLMLD